MSWPWSQLGLPGPSELSEVRHAYAEKLKTTHPEEDPEGFQRLHSAYQLASRMARQQKRRPEPMPQPERPARPEPSRPPEEEFNYEELLRDGGEQPRLRREEDGEQDFNFEELLQDGDGPSRPPRGPEEERDFDFERLFAEGEAERAEERRRRGEARRRAQAQARAYARERQKAQEWTRQRERWQRQEQQNVYDRERRDQFSQEEARWQNTETILHTLEMLHNARAPLGEWEKFFASPLFQQNKDSLDLIFGLEDFVSSKPMPREVRLALFLAYGFDKGPSRPELRPLYQMLLPDWRAENHEKIHERKLAILGVILGLVGPFILGPLLDMGFISAFFVSLGVVWIAWVIRKVVRTGSMEKRARGGKVSKKDELRAMLGFGLAVVLVLVLGWMRSNPGRGLRDLLPTRDPREQTCRYIREDFGVEVASLYNMNDNYATERYGNVFYLKDTPNRQFLAGPDGERERDLKHGKPGYTTNLPEMLLLWELRDFAKDHKMEPVDSLDRGEVRQEAGGVHLDQGLEQWETTGTFLITLPIDGGEDIIRDLGELLDRLKEEKWYKSLATRCTLVLCSQEMEEGRVVMIRTQPGLTVYSTAQCLGLYEETFAHECCAQILKELELDRDFMGEGEERYTLTNEGKAKIQGLDCYKLFGLDGDGEVAMEYYVYPKLRNIYCLPGNFWETGNTEDQLGFYRLLYWGDRGTFNLFYPWLRVG